MTKSIPHSEPAIRVKVDLTNPGQFFACCGLLELADRLWNGAEGWFEEYHFLMRCEGTVGDLVTEIAHASLVQLDMDDDKASPIEIGQPFRTIRLDWWRDEQSGGKELKVWAGSMDIVRIARAMQGAMQDSRFHSPGLFDEGMIVFNPANPNKKVEPFYFDARRASNAHSRDVGFSPNDLQMTTTAFPAVEFLCLVGLQRCLPVMVGRRIFEYCAWTQPIAPNIVSAAVTGPIARKQGGCYRFENWFRTGQRKHKAFRSATQVWKGSLL